MIARATSVWFAPPLRPAATRALGVPASAFFEEDGNQLEQHSQIASPPLNRCASNALPVVNQLQSECRSGLGQKHDRVIGVNGTDEIRDCDSSTEALSRFIHKVILKDDQTVKHPVAPGHFTMALNFHQGGELELAQFQKPCMKLPEECADRCTTIDKGAYRDIVNKRPDDRFDAMQYPLADRRTLRQRPHLRWRSDG